MIYYSFPTTLSLFAIFWKVHSFISASREQYNVNVSFKCTLLDIISEQRASQHSSNRTSIEVVYMSTRVFKLLDRIKCYMRFGFHHNESLLQNYQAIQLTGNTTAKLPWDHLSICHMLYNFSIIYQLIAGGEYHLWLGRLGLIIWPTPELSV